MLRRFFGAQESLLLFLLSSSAFLASCEQDTAPKSYFPETGRNALYQRSLDLRSNLNVLSIAIQPGYEDLSGLAYFRLGRGATVMSAYLTNGEAGESDVQAEYPAYLAAIRREEASKALSYLDGEVHFLNMPDIAAARDSAKVRELWPSDVLQTCLTKLFSQFKPDIVMLARDWEAGGESPRWDVLYSDVLVAVKKIAPVKSHKNLAGINSHQFWGANRVFIDSGERKGISIPVDRRHPRWEKMYRAIGGEAARAYGSLARQRRIWMNTEDPSYRLVYPTPPPPINEIDAGLPRPCTERLRWIEQEIQELTATTIHGKTADALKRIVAILDSVSFYLVRPYDLQAREERTLLHWKRGLESLRCTLLGVEVEYSISDTTLTERQLTFLTIDTVKGIDGKGKTDIYFTDLDPGWAINEDLVRRLPLRLHQKYRLLSPARVDYSYPPGQHELKSSTLGKPFVFFILHRSLSKEQNFVHSTTIDFTFAPRFIPEVLTPIVRMVPGERVVFRLTNLSRDGVADTIGIEDPLASSTESAFRLSYKGSSHLDTLFITWKGNPDEGSYLIPVQIDGITVANFAARKFHTEVDTSKKIGIITGLQNSPTENALRRLNVKFSTVGLGRMFSQQIDSLNVLIVDRRVLSLKPQMGDFKSEVENFVNRGGHLIVLSQDAATWNAKPLWAGMHLTPTLLFDESIPLKSDSTHTLLMSPNLITTEHWNGWLYLRGYNIVSVSALEDAQLPVKVKRWGTPLIISLRDGKGKRTYVDLALGHQWMNIHTGAFRLLANIISY